MKISEIMNDLQNYIRSQILYNNFTIIIATQNNTAKNYPFGSYKILRSEFEQPHQRITKREFSKTDNKLKVKSYYASKTVVQLNFYNKTENPSVADDSLDTILSIAQNSWMWLNEDGRDKLSESNMVLSFASPQITQEEKMEHMDGVCRVGFDFTLKKLLEHPPDGIVKEVGIIEEVSISEAAGPCIDEHREYTIDIEKHQT